MQLHKSAGNGVEPSEIIKDYGADIIRLWVASSDYTVDVRAGKNIFKPNSKTRIINYNKKIEERVYENSQLYPSEIQTDDITMPEGQQAEDNAFVDGILADVVSETNVPEKADDILENAQKQADDILNNARTEADDIISKAKEKAELIFKEKREEGYNTGLEDKREQLEKREKQIEMDIASKRSELEREFKQYSDELESDIIDAVIKVFNKVFHIQFDRI